MMMGRNKIKVATMAIKVLIKEAPMNKNAITKAATAKATPTP
jgi:hypothetical protein